MPSGVRQENGAEPGSGGEELVSALRTPESTVPIVVGGAGGAWSSVIPMWGLGAKTKAVTRLINAVR